MFVAFNEITVATEKAEMFEAEFARSMSETLPGLDGLRRTMLYRPNEPGDPYLVSMEFSDEDRYRTYLASAAFHTAHQGTSAGERAVLGSEVRTYTVRAEL